MSIHRDNLARAIDALRIHDARSFSWFGERTAADGRGDLSWDVLTARIRRRLYLSFYAQGVAVPSIDRRLAPAGMGRADLLAALAQANRGRGPRQGGWTITGVEETALIVRRGGVTVRVARERFWPDLGAPTSGATGAVQMPSELPFRVPGYYIALGNRVPAEDAGLARVYWNLLASRAPAVLGALTGALNAVGIPFEFKVLSDSSAYTRCDAGVLYVERSDLTAALDVVTAVAGAHRDALKHRVPAFTERVDAGLAWADDPGGGESFGLHRCGLVAASAVESHRDGDTDVLARVEESFGVAGIDLDEPHRRTAPVEAGLR